MIDSVLRGAAAAFGLYMLLWLLSNLSRPNYKENGPGGEFIVIHADDLEELDGNR